MLHVTEVEAARLLKPMGFVFFLLVLPAFLFALPAAAGTGIVSSYHDFTGEAIDGGYGPCTPCHQPHYSPDINMIWSRSLSEEAAYFDQDGSGANNANYMANAPLPGGTLGCYDCHDDNQNGIPLVQDNPRPDPPDSWPGNEEPQNIAFGDSASSGSDPSETGYYELQGGYVPNKGGPEAVPNPPTFPPVTNPIGGHYWKGVEETTDVLDSPMQFGDKMACTICHDPHDTAATGSNDVFLRTDIPAGSDPAFYIGNNLRASTASRNPTGGGGGREMCDACHFTSDSTATEREMFGVTVPKPPLISITGHDSGDTEECTKCHPHNAPDCGACHGSPPPLAAAGYTGITEAQGPHPRHANELDDADPGYEFDCNICHETFPDQHRNGSYEDVAFLAAKNPNGNYNTASNPNTCEALYCHSRGLWLGDTENNAGAVVVDWDDANWDANDPAASCEECHGGSGATLGDVEFGVPGYADNDIETDPPGTLKANKHSSHQYPCRVCHYTVTRDPDPTGGWTLYSPPGVPPDPPTTHVSNDGTKPFGYDVVSEPNASGADGSPGLWFANYIYAPTGGQCVNVDCHGGSSPTWDEELPCEDCHLSATTGADTDRDNWDPDDGVLTQMSETEWGTSGHGRQFVWFPWPDNDNRLTPPGFSCLTANPMDPGRDLVPTGGCHTNQVPHDPGDGAGGFLSDNPYRLVTAQNNPWPIDNPIDAFTMDDFCYNCHDQVTKITHSEPTTGGDNWTSPLRFKCVDCHDPHGDSPDYMINARVFADSSDNLGVPSTGGLGIRPPLGGPEIEFNIEDSGITDPQEHYVHLGSVPAEPVKICNVCHTGNAYFRRNLTASHNTTVDCMDCHPHLEGFKPICEACHSAVSAYVGDWPDPGDDAAPNVMGDSTNPIGISLPFDTGTWGFNVNGHGAQTGTPECADCHDISDPAGEHLDGTLNTFDWPGSPYGGPTQNTSHLTADFFPVGASPPEEDFQLAFDQRCYESAGCHTQPWFVHPTQGPQEFGHRHSDCDGDGNLFTRFGDCNTVNIPKTDRGAEWTGYWTPWTAGDITTDAPPPTSHYAICASCHEPHGIPEAPPGSGLPTPAGFYPAMLRYDHYDQAFFCNSNCHNP